ncbi:MAG: redox-sensing transcriptional repressor Rex [Deltaproteobacteria bacterium]|nr:redox-sensing transcriptional repressor Rex [Deltaproteobacteria bacterium]
MKKKEKIPNPAAERLVLYSRSLAAFMGNGEFSISSEKLAGLCNVNPAQVRKDLAYFGDFGVRGVGYDARDLLQQIKKILGTDRVWRLCIVGMGNLGTALVENENFKKRGYQFVAAFDIVPRKISRELPNGLIIESIEKIEDLVRVLSVDIGVITTPPREAQRTADRLVDAGVKAVMNFAPVQVRVPECCVAENVDFSVKLENLAYHLGKAR